MNEMLLELGQNAKEAENMLRTITTNKKNQVLAAVAEHLVECTDELIKANAVDVENGKKEQYAGRTGRQTSSYTGKNSGNGRRSAAAGSAGGSDR